MKDREAWPGIRRPDDIWDEIILAGEIPGTTSAPKLQPIAARIVMLAKRHAGSDGIKGERTGSRNHRKGRSTNRKIPQGSP